MKLGFTIKKSANEIKVQRNTKETKIIVNVNQIKEKKRSIETSNPFLNHMIETLAFRANLNIGIKIDSNTDLIHPIAEDTGITIGRSIFELYKSKITTGVEGCGFARGIIDEAFANVALSIEGRVNYFVNGPKFENVDGISGYDLLAFLEGFSQGCRCTLRIDYYGNDPHHTWEAIFRALGFAIRKAFESNSWRKDTISGLKGTLE
jgi:imidazoleglycerol phosphate dehydratase HisB